MQEDKKLQSLLSKYAVQQASQDFSEKVMQRIEAVKESKPILLISSAWLRMLLYIFITVVIALLILAFFIQPHMLAVRFSVPVSIDMYRQLFSFFAAFWFVMFINLFLNKRNKAAASI